MQYVNDWAPGFILYSDMPYSPIYNISSLVIHKHCKPVRILRQCGHKDDTERPCQKMFGRATAWKVDRYNFGK